MNREVAVIVGATGAFGEAIVERLISKGLHVLAVARNAETLKGLQSQYSEVSVCVADISNDTSILAIEGSIQDKVRMVVHGPGLNAPGNVAQVDPDAMAQSVNIKVGGMLRLVRASEKFFKHGTRLVSIGGHYGLEPTAYASSAGVANAALINLSRQLSLQYGNRGVTSHVIAPGPADTPRLRNVLQNSARQKGISLEEAIENLKSESSLGTLITPKEVAWAVSILLDEEASAMTGSTLMLDGGRRVGLP